MAVENPSFANAFEGKKVTHVGCVGAGAVGTCSMAMMASRMPDVKFQVYDDNPSVVCGCQSGNLPFYEPGLKAVLEKYNGVNLFFNASLEKVVSESQIIFVCINTPMKTAGAGTGRVPDLSGWDNIARRIGKASKGECKIVIECSTIPVATGETMRKVLHAIGKPGMYEVLCFPSFYRGGSAMRDMAEIAEGPAKVLLGSMETPQGEMARDTVAKFLAPWIPADKIVHSNIWSAELSKLAQNAFIAQRISSVNAVSMLCEKTGADLSEVMAVIGTDSRLGAGYLKASSGMGGPTLLQNLKMLVYLCEHLQLHEVADYWSEVLKMNEFQSKRFCDNIVHTMTSVKDKKIAILGFAYKPNTSDTRESPAITICNSLLSEGCSVSICDPQVPLSSMLEHLNVKTALQVEKSETAMEALTGASAAVVVTDWDEFRSIDMAEALKVMEKPPYIFDSRNVFDYHKMTELGFQMYAIGHPR